MSLSKKKDVDVIVNLSPRALPRNGFNIGMLLGKTTIFDATTRTKSYGSANEMIEDGFALSDPLYLGAVEYFKQQDNLGASLSEVVIGAVKLIATPIYAWKYNTTKIYTLSATPTAGDAVYTVTGTATGDTITSVTTSDDVVTAIVVSSDTYARSADDDTSFNTSNYEDYDDALLECRNSNSDWYGFTVVDVLTETEIEAIADKAEVLDATMFVCSTNSSTALTDNASNIMKIINAKKYDRTILTYHTNQYFGCGLLGYAMGANTGLINSAYSLKFKQIVGQVADVLSTSQVNAIEKYYGNCYVTRADAQYEQGTCASGTWFDEMINLDKLVNDIQLNVYDLLYSLPKEPQTEAGHADIAGVISQACEQSKKIGFIGTDLKWRRPSILALQKGDVLPNGYLIQWEDVNEQSDADRDARQSQPFYVCINLAGATHSVLIQVNVSR